MLNGDVLLLFGNKNSKQIPAKIYDYFGAKGRILVIYGDSNDPIKSVVENNEKCINTENTSKEIKEKIYEIIKMHKNKTLESNPDFFKLSMMLGSVTSLSFSCTITSTEKYTWASVEFNFFTLNIISKYS